jgi:hypothetical protein
MKFIFAFILVTFFGTTFADIGNCSKYRVEVHFASGESLGGFIYAVYYDPVLEFDSLQFFNYIVYECSTNDTLTVFTAVYELAYPELFTTDSCCDFRLNAANPDAVTEIPVSDIQYIKHIETGICYNCSVYDSDDKFRWVGITPVVITELTNVEIELLQSEPYATHNFYYPEEHDRYIIVSYNNAIGVNDLGLLCHDFLDILSTQSYSWNNFMKEYHKFKQSLRADNIIIFSCGFMP